MNGIHLQLAVATNNRNKLTELRAMIDANVDLVSLDDLGLPSPDETGATFVENAAIKARFMHGQTGLPAIADDSGLMVDALSGAPGVRSARFAGDDASDEVNCQLLLSKLAGVPDSQRTARFQCVIALVDRHGAIEFASGTCEGRIAFDMRGVNGFGYDPLFVLPDGRTMAELVPEEKNRISHRAIAMATAVPLIRNMLGVTER